MTTKLTAARTTRNKAKGHETPKGRSGSDREEDSTSNVPEVVDSRPALSTAFTQTWWGPLDKWRVVLVAVPTDRNGPPSMLTSCLAIPEASSEDVHRGHVPSARADSAVDRDGGGRSTGRPGAPRGGDGDCVGHGAGETACVMDFQADGIAARRGECMGRAQRR